MKKTIFLILSITTLTACATFQPQPAFDWRGQNVDSYIIKYGVPTSQYTLQDGNTVYSFKKNCSQTNAQEELLIIITPDNVIQEISKASTCPTPPPEPIYYETGYIAPPPAHEKPMPKHKEQVAPKPKPVQDKPEPKPQVQAAAPKPKPTENKPAPKPQAQVAAPDPKPTNNNLLQELQKKESSDTKSNLSLMAKLGINTKGANNSNKQTEEKKTNNIKQALSSVNNKSSKEVLGEKIKETKQKEQYKTNIFNLGKNNTKK